MFAATDGTFLEKDFISEKVSGSNIFLEKIRKPQQIDVDLSTSEVEVLMQLPMDEKIYHMHDTF